MPRRLGRGIDVVVAGVHWAADELQRREHLRGDRTIGTAIGQTEQVHSYGDYEVEVDTSVESIATCSAPINE